MQFVILQLFNIPHFKRSEYLWYIGVYEVLMASYSETCFRPEGELRSLELLLPAAKRHNHRPNLHPDRQLVSCISAHNQRPLDSETDQ